MARKKAEETLLTVKPLPGNYEMVVVFKPFLPDKVRNEADDRVTTIISDVKGKVGTKDIWGKRYLAYKVQGHVEGYYVMYQFEAPKSGLDDIKKFMNRHQEVLRYLIIRKDENDTTAPKIKVKKSISSIDSDDTEE